MGRDSGWQTLKLARLYRRLCSQSEAALRPTLFSQRWRDNASFDCLPVCVKQPRGSELQRLAVGARRETDFDFPL
jgi:hypothetical protein